MKTIKFFLAAITFFAAITLLGTAQAQINLLEPPQVADTNPLLRTTGPNTVGKGRLQLSGDASFYGFRQNMEMFDGTIHHHNARVSGGGLGLRIGLGSRVELLAGFSGYYERYHHEFDLT